MIHCLENTPHPSYLEETLRCVDSMGQLEGHPLLPAPGRLSIEDLQRALDEDRVTLLLQPQFDLQSGGICGVETLARMRSESGELISPAHFLPLAESTGFIRPLGRRLFQLACQAAKTLADEGWSDLRVAINLSAIQLANAKEIGDLLELLRQSEVLPTQIEIELTESAPVECFACVHRQLQRFRALGATVALDDFGTGFNSLSYLLELDIDRLKIDRKFISAIDHNKRSKLTATLIELGRKLALDVIAEGVETEAEANWLRLNHCPSVQGFYFSRPLTLGTVLAKLRESAGSAWTLADHQTMVAPQLGPFPPSWPALENGSLH